MHTANYRLKNETLNEALKKKTQNDDIDCHMRQDKDDDEYSDLYNAESSASYDEL